MKQKHKALLQRLPDHIIEPFQAYMRHNKNNEYTEKTVSIFNQQYQGCYDSELDYSRDILDQEIDFYCDKHLRPFIQLDYNGYHADLFNSGKYYSLKDKKGNSHIFKEEIRK